MPRPVEALPCGSRSMISTSSPMAASAVPRLIAVVVLPTPPFWLAMASIRGGRVRATCPSLCSGASSTGADGSDDDVSLIAADPPVCGLLGPESIAGRGPRVRFEATHDDDSRLRIGPTHGQTCLNLPIFSGFGQFTVHILPFGKEAICALFQQGIGLRQELRHRRQGPRGDDVDCWRRTRH